MPARMIERPSARLILLDPQDRLFLFKVHQPSVYDPADPSPRPVPDPDRRPGRSGRGLSPTRRSARRARRPASWSRTCAGCGARAASCNGATKQVLHREQFFLGRARLAPPSTRPASTRREKSWTLDHRWWSADEIALPPSASSRSTLARAAEGAAADGPPAEPFTCHRGRATPWALEAGGP